MLTFRSLMVHACTTSPLVSRPCCPSVVSAPAVGMRASPAAAAAAATAAVMGTLIFTMRSP
ncbi:Uncharacterised protein [Mycobacteroides abscessus subsp. abscessus]|nr:Uncharacterised protein [Mycobacteroides abscessus subsp. abscessus]SKV57377.1 Uncharacterised protein [Mycobacteroides abscessus subsp. abscessus]SKV85893.1 Uncharacterised protein [Mycobacteroides abscessus subsp. abscessus]